MMEIFAMTTVVSIGLGFALGYMFGWSKGADVIKKEALSFFKPKCSYRLLPKEELLRKAGWSAAIYRQALAEYQQYQEEKTNDIQG